MQLSNIQNLFSDILLKSGDLGALAGALESDHIALDERLRIYRDNVMGSLTGVMATNYPIVENLVGGEFMKMMAERFIENSPPEGGCLNSYGAQFPAFIADFELAKALPYLPDVARLEWALHEAYHAKDDTPLSAEELGSVPPEKLESLKLGLRDSVHLVSSKFPLIAIRAFCQNENRHEDDKLDLTQGGIRLMVYRPALKVESYELDEASFEMLLHLQSGLALGPALEKTLSAHESFDIQGFLQSQLKLETFLSLRTNR